MKGLKPKAKPAQPTAMDVLVLEPGDVIHYQGLPFFITSEVEALGAPENVARALALDGEAKA